jgi:hypothetical protein
MSPSKEFWVNGRLGNEVKDEAVRHIFSAFL